MARFRETRAFAHFYARHASRETVRASIYRSAIGP
jgi:hypothetical protein